MSRARTLLIALVPAILVSVFLVIGCESSDDGAGDSGEQAAVDVTGSWSGYDTGGAGGATGNLVQDGNSVSGDYQEGSGTAGRFSGFVNGTMFNGTLNTDDGRTYQVQAAVDGNRMNGTWRLGNATGGWTGTRQ